IRLRGRSARVPAPARSGPAMRLIAAFAIAGAVAAAAHAGNGTQPIGYSALSILLGGADTALAQGGADLAGNPAGMAHVPNAQCEGDAELYAVDLRWQQERSRDRIAGLASASCARRIDATRWTLGVGAFVQ